jgi:RimJ/RimL family protein N-acetyltransferase
MDILDPVVLEGDYVRLEPLTLDYVDALAEVGLDERIWQLTPRRVESRADVESYVKDALAEQSRGRSLPFAIVMAATDTVVGSTRFGNLDLANRKLEIGWTWVARPWQRTTVNTESKLLMLRYAFDDLDVRRVEFKTDARNSKSQWALGQIGAHREGTLRQHTVLPDGSSRDTVYFSIISDEWPDVEARLEKRLKNKMSEREEDE